MRFVSLWETRRVREHVRPERRQTGLRGVTDVALAVEAR
jgi:hypothetical protein